MEPVEINAGEFYLRQWRADDRIDDREALVAAGRCADRGTAGEFVADRTRRWDDDSVCSWAVCDQLTGTAVGEVALTAEGGLTCWTTPARRREGIARHAVSAVVGFGFGFLDLPRIDAVPHDDAGLRLAHACGFEPDISRGVWTRLR
ncbi:GNAT family N-acetyltransferase [Saccharothrix violaceirubra]|uniref:RimJ/RimL family protein N-acetyltransferase n=1 Tax=Saccharothrix violaceirubra TaxID=413306 RepID=A0A7W7SY56_9PSEU|nr:GNAT family protein [Saccharothrix violaceirubra]MBB4963112.1 RimJ/RimL family protein N-acetyltransferase [Saccharothrix violaceirubra]